MMLKIVPDPPHNAHSLEDTLIQATDYALRALLESALIQVQMPTGPRTLH